MRTLSKRIQTLQKKLDRLVQIHYVPQYEKCLVCGNPNEVMHHYIQKGQSTYLRYHKKNLIPLCNHCHCLHHQTGEPRIVATIAKKKGKEWENWILEHQRIRVKNNLAYEKKLKKLINKYQD